MGATIRLGVDVGGVIMERMNPDSDTSFHTDNYLQTPTMPDVYEALRFLSGLFEGEVYIVSKCGRKTEEKTLDYFEHHNFYERTGIKPENVRFCRKRQDKGAICDEQGITHFVDDRLEVLSCLTTVEHKYLFRPNEEEVAEFQEHLGKVVRVESWDEVLQRI